MKNLIMIITLLSSFAVSASDVSLESVKNCKYYQSYDLNGWKVHDPANFEIFKKEVVKTIHTAVEAGTTVFDISGPILTKQTIDNQPLLLDAMMFDNLKTSKDLMYGDYAILEVSNNTHEIAELRWFDGKTRNIIINPKFLKCLSEGAPFVDNSVL